MYDDMLATVVCSEFARRVGKRMPSRALLIPMHTSVDFDKEEGYRFIDLLLWAPANYVAVLARRRWTVIPLDDLDYDEHGECFVKEGRDYTHGESKWHLLAYHDSTWRGAVRDFFRDNRDDIQGFASSVGGWADDLALKEEMEEELASIVSECDFLGGYRIPEAGQLGD